MLTIFERAPRPSRGAVLLGAVALGLMLLAGLAQVLAGETPVKVAASPATVQIDNFAFAPATLTVSAGTTVTWKNEDDSPHRIGDNNGTFKSAALDMRRHFLAYLRSAGRVPVYLHDPSLHGREDHCQTRRQVLVIDPSPSSLVSARGKGSSKGPSPLFTTPGSVPGGFHRRRLEILIWLTTSASPRPARPPAEPARYDQPRAGESGAGQRTRSGPAV
jgi:plastocyanin